MTFPGSIQKDRGQPSLVRMGRIGADGLVYIQDTALEPDAVGFQGGYAPVAGDTVAVMGQSAIGTAGSSWLVLGRVNTTGMDSLRGVRLTVGVDSIASVLLDPVNWSATDWDTDGFYDPGNPGVITMPFTGVFAFTFNLVMTFTAAGGIRYIEISVNGVRRVSHRHPAIVNDFADLGLATEMFCEAGDEIRFNGFQNTGAPLNTLEGSATIRLIGTLGS